MDGGCPALSTRTLQQSRESINVTRLHEDRQSPLSTSPEHCFCSRSSTPSHVVALAHHSSFSTGVTVMVAEAMIFLSTCRAIPSSIVWIHLVPLAYRVSLRKR